MKALYVFFLIALITCNNFVVKDSIFLNDINDHITYSTFYSNDSIEIIEFSPKQLIRSKQLDAKIIFKAKKNLDLQKMILNVKYSNLELTENVEINKSLSSGELYTYENSKYSIPSNMMGKAKLNLKLINKKNEEIYHAQFNLVLKKIDNAVVSDNLCGSKDYLEMTDFSPKEVKPGQSITAKMTVKAKKNLDIAKVTYEVKWSGVTLVKEEEAIGKSLGAGESYSNEKSAQLYSFLLGKCELILKVYDSEKELYCMNFSVIF